MPADPSNTSADVAPGTDDGLANGGAGGGPPDGARHDLDPGSMLGGGGAGGLSGADGSSLDGNPDLGGGGGGGATEDPGDPGSAGADAGDGSVQATDVAANDDVPWAGGADLAGDLANAVDGAADQGIPGLIDAHDDTVSVDARGKKTCPTSINGALERTDPTQTGRLSRVAPASTCGTSKDFPGNGADLMYAHLYDVYHFINPANVPVCFTFTLTYATYGQLYAAAYSSFDPTDITDAYLGDVGDTLASPQTMGITVNAGASLDVVVSAVAIGTEAAGSYVLSCTM